MILRANWIELVTGELVGVRVVAGDEIDASVHERGEEGDVAREPVQLSDDQLGALALALRQRLRQLGAGGMRSRSRLRSNSPTSCQEPPSR